MKPEELEKLHNIIMDTPFVYTFVRARYDVEHDHNVNAICAYHSPTSPLALYDYTCIDYTRYNDSREFTYDLLRLFTFNNDTVTVQADDLTIEQAQEIIDRNTVYFAKAKEYFEQKQILTELGAL